MEYKRFLQFYHVKMGSWQNFRLAEKVFKYLNKRLEFFSNLISGNILQRSRDIRIAGYIIQVSNVEFLQRIAEKVVFDMK